jgi:hypothetical protein
MTIFFTCDILQVVKVYKIITSAKNSLTLLEDERDGIFTAILDFPEE